MLATHTDQLGRKITLSRTPESIVSVVPSQTELLYHLGLEREVSGITKFCIHPKKWYRSKTRIGGTKQLHIDRIKSLAPDLIIANKEENSQQDIETLMASFPVWVSDISTLTDALEMIRKIGELTSKQPQANKIVFAIKQAFQQIKPLNSPLKVAYLIWNDPLMCAGENTFIDHMLGLCGFVNVCSKGEGRYPEFDVNALKEKQPDLILLSSEPYPFSEKHRDELATHFPNSSLLLVDGELFSWYGSRLMDAPAYFNRLLTQIDQRFVS
jgi:ABC-type Fe3+-hydroxamate transport system substrate-binding protein